MTRESIFIKKEIGEKESITNEIVGFWRIYAENYRNAVEDYHNLLEKKRQLNLSVRGVRKHVLQDFTKIGVFEIETENEVLGYLETMEVENLKIVLKAVKKAVDSYEYKTLTSTISIFRDEIYREEQKKRRKLALSGY